MASWVECCLCKSNDLSLNPQHPCKKLGMAASSWNPSAGEVETGGYLGPLSQPISPNQWAGDAVKFPVSKNKLESNWGNHTWHWLLNFTWPERMCTCAHAAEPILLETSYLSYNQTLVVLWTTATVLISQSILSMVISITKCLFHIAILVNET